VGGGGAPLALVLCILALAGCGGEGDATDTEAGLPMAGGGGTLTIAVPKVPDGVDPLTAEGSAELLVARQIHEPLIGPLKGPYGSAAVRPGLALSATPSADRTVWTLELRPGVRFQDGTPFNASAVLANARRWLSTARGRAALPDLFAVDAPRPHEVRFQLRAPDPGLPRRLRSAALGIVSPQALDPRSGDEASVLDVPGTGTGPFETGPRSASELNLGRNAAWWGSPLGLGPSLESIVVARAASERARLQLLLTGEAQVADPLGEEARAEVDADPLLDAITADGRGIGLEASVRGLTGEVQSLSGVWLTRVGD
jgi:peptide/nickel transport system substrate-binding protein